MRTDHADFAVVAACLLDTSASAQTYPNQAYPGNLG